MNKANKYGRKSLLKDFPTDQACLEFLFDANHSRECSCGGHYSLMPNGLKADGTPRLKRTFQCSKCRFKISPTANTIFHKSETPLTVWFEAILLFSNAKSGISATYLARELELYYKVAYRMLMQIRKALGDDTGKLKDIVEIDVGYLGGVRSVKNRMSNKTNVLAAKQRGGNIKAYVVEDAGAQTHKDFLDAHVERNSILMTDKTKVLDKVAKPYDRYSVDHGRSEYVRGPVHVNNLEAFFSHVKRSVTGVHKSISQKHAQNYLNGYVFQWNNGRSDKERFALLLGRLLQSAG